LRARALADARHDRDARRVADRATCAAALDRGPHHGGDARYRAPAAETGGGVDLLLFGQLRLDPLHERVIRRGADRLGELISIRYYTGRGDLDWVHRRQRRADDADQAHTRWSTGLIATCAKGSAPPTCQRLRSR